MPKYFDIHSHLNFPQYDQDREEVIERLRETETNTIVVGTDLESSQRAVELAEAYEGIYACIGVHPIPEQARYGTGPVGFDISEFTKLVKHPKVVAIGECGLDFYHAKKEADYDRQKRLFLEQVEFALEHNKPLMIHARDAYEELLEILEPLKVIHRDMLRGNIHFFAGNWAIAERFMGIGFTLSFTGVITLTEDYDDVIKRAPLSSIMSETDSPYVAPIPYRGKRNEPSYVSLVVKRIAEIRGEPLEVVQAALVENALTMVG